ncbi:hypothetical protein EBT31_14930 [bacterium]|nr:hypothetical protein [bacterium]
MYEVWETYNPLNLAQYRFIAVPQGGCVEDDCGYGATPEEAIEHLREVMGEDMSDFPRDEVVRVLEDVQAFLSSFRGLGGDVSEAVQLAQLVSNVLAKCK